jgi:membrane associated rhomboid family serine protease
MLQPPSLTNAPRYPVTAGLAIGAMVVTGLWWSGQSIDPFFTNGDVWYKWELWRAFTSTLPHVSFFHLAFNLYWIWVFGTLLEGIYGHLRFAGIVVLLAFSSALAEFALLRGGVGLSGVGYGFWGMLWVLEKHDARFAGAVDENTSRLFVIWFFVCIGLTVTNVMPIANIAHGVGAVAGALLGLAASRGGAVKWRSIAALAAVVISVLLASTVFWPQVNLTDEAEDEVEHAGVEALYRNDNAEARRLLEIATQMRHASARTWYNLGVAYGRLHDHDKASAMFEHAAQMPGATSDVRAMANALSIWRGTNSAKK